MIYNDSCYLEMPDINKVERVGLRIELAKIGPTVSSHLNGTAHFWIMCHTSDKKEYKDKVLRTVCKYFDRPYPYPEEEQP